MTTSSGHSQFNFAQPLDVAVQNLRRQRNLTVFPAACTWEKIFYLYILTTKCFPVVDLVWPALDALPARRSGRFFSPLGCFSLWRFPFSRTSKCSEDRIRNTSPRSLQWTSRFIFWQLLANCLFRSNFATTPTPPRRGAGGFVLRRRPRPPDSLLDINNED